MMFYCNPCGSERGWPIDTPIQSHGRCEVCGKGAACNDVASQHLPKPANQGGELRADDPETWLETVWDGLHAYREDLIPEGDEQYDAIWSDICTAMAWIRERVEEPIRGDSVYDALEKAESFITGFEGDETQEGIDELLAEIRDELEYRPSASLDWSKPIEWSTGEEATFADYDDAMPDHHVSACSEWRDVTGDNYVAVDDAGQILGCEDEGYPVIRNKEAE